MIFSSVDGYISNSLKDENRSDRDESRSEPRLGGNRLGVTRASHARSRTKGDPATKQATRGTRRNISA